MDCCHRFETWWSPVESKAAALTETALEACKSSLRARQQLLKAGAGEWETHFKCKDSQRLIAKGWKKIPCQHETKESWSCHINIRWNRFQSKELLPRDFKSHIIMIKEWICQDNIPFLNVYGLNNRASVHMQQKLTQFQLTGEQTSP